MKFLKDLINNVTEVVSNLKDMCVSFFQLYESIFSFLPNPFDKILMTFSTVILAVIIYKIVKG